MSKVSPPMQAEIDRLCAQGDAHADRARFPDALHAYWAAWDLLPAPKLDCQAATLILAAVGDANFLGGDFEAGRDNLSTVMHCPGALHIPFLHMRLGQCQFELGELAFATRELTLAYVGGGADLFDGEESKYRDCVPAGALGASLASTPWRFWKSG